MARTAVSYSVNTKKKTIVVYTNVEQPEAERNLIRVYVESGYKVLFGEKKAGMTVDKMRKAMKDDEKYIKEFNEWYEQGKFFEACAVYSEFAKKQKEAKKNKEDK
jgi:hypothetical protein